MKLSAKQARDLALGTRLLDEMGQLLRKSIDLGLK
jgi:hypothetical protein